LHAAVALHVPAFAVRLFVRYQPGIVRSNRFPIELHFAPALCGLRARQLVAVGSVLAVLV